MPVSTSISPLAPKTIPQLPVVAGVRLATAEAGFRYRGRADVMLAVFDRETSVAGVFTRSKCPSAPVEWCRVQLKGHFAHALVVNSGNANAFTGKSGRQACALTAKFAAAAVGCKTSEVFLASTGVIGEPLDARAFERVMADLAAAARPDG
jgi:glutamate N-acetyltransferase/amino-acid N-acetyltransferase